MLAMRDRYQRGEFGLCPCCGSNVLPIGLSVTLNQSKVKVYCNLCEDVYVPQGQRSPFAMARNATIDGAYFGGPSFPHILLMNSGVNSEDNSAQRQVQSLEPTLFGFKIRNL